MNRKPQVMDAIRWTLTFVWVAGLIYFLATGDTGPNLGIWVGLGLAVGVALALWQKSHPDRPAGRF